MDEASHPVDGGVFMLAGTKASVTLPVLSRLLRRVQRHLADRRDAYRRGYERVALDEADVYLVDPGHWEAIGEALELDHREMDAVRRAHTEQFRRLGRRHGRIEEFETALDIREVVLIA